MIIALDYDGTYTVDPPLWDAFVRAARLRGHAVHLVTMRAACEPVRLGCEVDRIHYTDRQAKRPYMQARGYVVQVWIDDMPDFILGPAAPRDLAANAAAGLWADQVAVSSGFAQVINGPQAPGLRWDGQE